MSEKVISDPDNYYKLASNYRSIEDTEKALTAFWEEFYELRNKYAIPDAYLIIRMPVVWDDGKKTIVFNTMMCGCGQCCDEMTAFAFGAERRRRQGHLADVVEASMEVPQEEADRQSRLFADLDQ